jgi:anti-anti-sigma regulatory factor
MTMSATADTGTRVDCVYLADGMLLRLAGPMTSDLVPALRQRLLGVLPEGCVDVVIDAGDVTAMSDDVVAVLLAAAVWVKEQQGRLLLSRVSSELAGVLDELGMTDDLPRLAELGGRRPAVPQPRAAAD